MDLDSRRWKAAKWALALAYFGVIGTLLVTRARSIDWSEVVRAVKAVPPHLLGLGLLLTTITFACFAGYDLLARQRLKHSAGAARSAGIALTAYALNLNLGSIVGGWASRLRLYARAGVNARTTLRIITLGILSNWSGFFLLGGFTFCFFPLELPEAWKIPAWAVRAVGVAMLAIIGSYLLLCQLRPGKRFTVGKLTIEVPTWRFSLVQLGLSCASWMAMAGILALYLPKGVGYGETLSILVLASVAGVVVPIPAGLGVTEAVFVALLADGHPATKVLAALLAYRATFYLAPLALAAVAYPMLEMAPKAMRGRGTASDNDRAPATVLASKA